MNEKQKKSVSKFLSLVLRHQPEIIGLELDANGWASVEELISKSTKEHTSITREDLEDIVATNDKQRFIFNTERTHIRANQGHSIEIELDLKPQTPPPFLFHGTVEKFLELIRVEGLKKMSRQHVHLSKDRETAEKVGNRRGKAIILIIASGKMFENGYSFLLSENGVWLTDTVPAQYVEFGESQNRKNHE